MRRGAGARDASRAALLDAAERLLARFGYAKVTMEDVAREAGRARRTAYLHFATKEDVVLGTIDRVIERVAESLRAIAKGPGSAPARLERMLVARVLVRADSVRQYGAALDQVFAAVRPRFLERRKAYFEAETQVFAGVLRQGQADGQLRPGRVRALAECLLTATNALLPHGLSRGDLADRGRTARMARDVARLLIAGLQNPRNGV